MIIENLRYLLQSYNSSDPIWFGCKFGQNVKPQGYMSGGAGIKIERKKERERERKREIERKREGEKE